VTGYFVVGGDKDAVTEAMEWLLQHRAADSDTYGTVALDTGSGLKGYEWGRFHDCEEVVCAPGYDLHPVWPAIREAAERRKKKLWYMTGTFNAATKPHEHSLLLLVTMESRLKATQVATPPTNNNEVEKLAEEHTAAYRPQSLTVRADLAERGAIYTVERDVSLATGGSLGRMVKGDLLHADPEDFRIKALVNIGALKPFEPTPQIEGVGLPEVCS